MRSDSLCLQYCHTMVDNPIAQRLSPARAIRTEITQGVNSAIQIASKFDSRTSPPQYCTLPDWENTNSNVMHYGQSTPEVLSVHSASVSTHDRIPSHTFSTACSSVRETVSQPHLKSGGPLPSGHVPTTTETNNGSAFRKIVKKTRVVLTLNTNRSKQWGSKSCSRCELSVSHHHKCSLYVSLPNLATAQHHHLLYVQCTKESSNVSPPPTIGQQLCPVMQRDCVVLLKSP